MSEPKKLEYLINKAIQGGFTYLGKPENGWGVGHGQWSVHHESLLINDKMGDHYVHQNAIIFRHDFAMALFGTNASESISFRYHSASTDAKKPLIGEGLIPIYIHHMQEAIVAGDPVDYMYETIKSQE